MQYIDFPVKIVNYLPSYLNPVINIRSSRDSLSGIATRYRLYSPGIESQSGRDFPFPFRAALGSTQPPTQWVPSLFTGGKAAGRGVSQPPPGSGEVKERVELYLCFPLWAFVVCSRVNFTFTLTLALRYYKYKFYLERYKCNICV